MTDSEFHENPDEHLAERLESISDEEAEKRATALEAGLSSYDLEDEDRALLDAYGFEFEAEETRGADPSWPSSGAPTWANRPWSTGSSAAVKPWSKTSPESPVTG